MYSSTVIEALRLFQCIHITFFYCNLSSTGKEFDFSLLQETFSSKQSNQQNRKIVSFLRMGGKYKIFLTVSL